MKAYTIDLRERIVEFVKDVGAKTEAALRFKVSRKTVYRYLEAAAAGRLTPKRSWGRWTVSSCGFFSCPRPSRNR